MSRLSIKTLERKSLPYGKFKFMVLLERDMVQTFYCPSNASQVEELRTLLRTTCKGHYRLDFVLNSKKKRVYTHLYLMEAMDLAMIKLVHLNKLFKLYRIKVQTPEES
jgi:hypothetical protein